MRKPLTVPAVLMSTVIGGSSLVAGLLACDSGGKPPVDATVTDSDGGSCSLFCIPDGTDAGTCTTCADSMGQCPVGCRPVG